MALLFLDEVREDAVEEVGVKAATLARLRRLGFPVPDGFVLPPEAPLDESSRIAFESPSSGICSNTETDTAASNELSG